MTPLPALEVYLGCLLLAANRLLNAIAGGSPDETVSLRAAKLWKEGRRSGCVLCKILDFFHADHCRIVAWRNGVDDMPEDENLHHSELPAASLAIALVMITLAAPLGWFLAALILGNT
jgi:hypothetical protein